MSVIGAITLLGISGPAGSGKDTVAEHFRDEYKTDVIAFADPMKRALREICGFPIDAWADRQWKERVIDTIGKSPRELAQTLGTEWGRNKVGKSFWVNEALSRWRANGSRPTVISDVRFDNEAQAIRDAGGIVIAIRRPTATAVVSHSSEGGIDPDFVDAYVNNFGTIADLCHMAEEAVFRVLSRNADR